MRGIIVGIWVLEFGFRGELANLVALDGSNGLRCYCLAVLRSFQDAETERVWKEERARSLPLNIRKLGLKKLQMLTAAGALADLAVPPGNRLERLRGDREGQHSIRVNDQCRICFEWREGSAYNVEITDYH
jgi:proteic killer suppression protein